MQQTQNTLFTLSSSLLSYDTFQADDHTDKEMERDFKELVDFLGDRSEVEKTTELQSQVSNQNVQRYAQVMNALLYGIMTDEKQAHSYYKFLMLCVRDNFNHIISHLKYFSGQLFSRLQEKPRSQIIWFIDVLIERKVPQSDSIMLLLLRNIQAGNTSPSNMRHIQRLLLILEKHEPWVKSKHGIISTSVYTFLRTILDVQAEDQSLATQLFRYCQKYLMENMLECRVIGRDLVRAMSDLSKLPLIQDFYQQFMSNQPAIPNHWGIQKLLANPTPKHFLQTRLSHDLEANILFIMEKVQWGLYDEIYFKWFQKLHLDSNNSNLIADLIRYITCVFHPPNALLQSKVIPRFAVIGKMIQFVKEKNLSRSLQMALMIDWIGFDANLETIMNIEVSTLMMNESAEKYPILASIQINTLSYLVKQFWAPLSPWFMSNVKNAVKKLLELGVIRNFDRILNGKKLDQKTKIMGRSLFTIEEEKVEMDHDDDQMNIDFDNESLASKQLDTPTISKIPTDEIENMLEDNEEIVFEESKELGEQTIAFQKQLMEVLRIYKTNSIEVEKLSGQLKPIIEARFKKSTILEDRGTDGLFNLLLEEENENEAISKLFVHILNDFQADDEEKYTAFMARLILFCIRNINDYPEIFDVYERYLATASDKCAWISQVKAIADEDFQFFINVLPTLLRQMKNIVGNYEFIHEIFCCLDPNATYLFMTRHSTGTFSLVTKDGKLILDMDKIGSITSEWDSFEQTNFWTILCTEVSLFPAARDILISRSIMPYLKDLDNNAEMCIGLFLLFKSNPVLLFWNESLSFLFDCFSVNPRLSQDVLRLYLTQKPTETIDSLTHYLTIVGKNSSITAYDARRIVSCIRQISMISKSSRFNRYGKLLSKNQNFSIAMRRLCELAKLVALW